MSSKFMVRDLLLIVSRISYVNPYTSIVNNSFISKTSIRTSNCFETQNIDPSLYFYLKRFVHYICHKIDASAKDIA